MQRTRFKNVANKTGNEDGLKKQQNFVVNLNRDAKRNFYNSINPTEASPQTVQNFLRTQEELRTTPLLAGANNVLEVTLLFEERNCWGGVQQRAGRGDDQSSKERHFTTRQQGLYPYWLYDNLTQKQCEALKKVTERDDLVITRGDKGRAIVVCGGIEEYLAEANSQLNNTEFYQELTVNPFEDYQKVIINSLNKMLSNNIIDKESSDIL
eukprot:Seg831.9 transcript_id=Seg831.9/GoldUCD/mRNA.D3Y31 product="hypothetical protein" protein_id=Seg831.9/GoldUCD/D3Y31